MASDTPIVASVLSLLILDALGSSVRFIQPGRPSLNRSVELYMFVYSPRLFRRKGNLLDGFSLSADEQDAVASSMITHCLPPDP